MPETTVSQSLIFGAGIHRAIERHFEDLLAGSPPPSHGELLVEYQNEWSERDAAPGNPSDAERTTLDDLAGRMIQALRSHDMSRPQGKILGVEETLRGSVIDGLPDLLGRVDLIVEERDALVIHDWKTSRSRWTYDQVEEAGEQLLLYAELAREFAPGKSVRLEFSVLTKTKTVGIERFPVVVEQGRIERLKRVVKRVWQAIESEHFYPSPSVINCAGCPFREPCRRWEG